MANQTDTRSSAQIRRDLEGARSELHHTVDALEHRLSPGQIVDEVWGRVRGSADEGSVRAFGDVVRKHPAPAALIGLGLAWLAAESRGGGDSVERMREGAGRAGSAGVRKVKSGASAAAGAAKEKAQHVADKVRERASGAADSVKEGMKEGLSDARERASNLREHAGESMRGDGATDGSRRRSSFDRQPLAAGALSFGVGLAAGLAAPSTEREDRLVPGHLKQAAHEIGRAAKEEARERAEQEEIDPEGIRCRAAHAGEDIRDRRRQTDR